MKKYLALVLAITLALGTFSFAAAAPADIAGTDYEDAIVRLGALGIIEGFPDGTYRSDQPVTRAQLAKIIVTALGVGEAANYAAGTTKFSDVPAGHWGAGYINVAADVGVINGYPDGTFKPENQVTFAEAIKMIVAALGYTPKADALGGYPGGYLAVAAEKDITKGISVVGALPANRGDVALMIDNCLDVPMMVQKTYGQYPEYEEDDTKTLLVTKLGVDEIKGVVTGVPFSDSRLKDDEIRINGKEYTSIIDMDLNYFFGLEVKAWADDDEVFFIEIDTDEDDILHDTVAASNRDGIELYVEDDEYEWARSADVYINFEEAGPEDLSDGMYGRVVLDDDQEARFASFFKFNTIPAGVITDEEDDIYELVTADGGEEELDLEDYDDGVYVFGPRFEKLSVKDIDVDSAVFAWEDDDELYVMVVNDKEDGNLERVRADSLRVDSTIYDVARNGCAFSDDGKDSFDEFASIDDLDNLGGEEVTLVFDLNGEVLFVYGEAEATSGWMYGIVMYGSLGKGGEASIFTRGGKEADYSFEERADARILDGLGYFEIVDDPADPANDDLEFAAIRYKLNKHGEIDESDHEIELLQYVNDAVPATYTLSKTAERAYVNIADASGSGTGRYYIDEDTVFMTAVNSDGELDPEVLDYEDIYDIAIAAGEEVFVFGTAGKAADFIVFLNPDFEGIAEDVYYGVVTDDPWKERDDWVAEIDVFDEGKAEYVLVTHGDYAEGDLVKFYLNSKGKAVMAEDQDTLDGPGGADTTGGDIVYYDNSGGGAAYVDGYLDVGSSYKVDSNAVIYELDEDGDDIEGTISKSRMDDFENIVYAVDDEIVVAVTVWDGPSGPAATDAKATIASDYILDDPADTVTVKLTAATGKDFNDYTLVIYSAGAYVKSVALTAASEGATGDVFAANAGLGLADNTEYTLKVVELATGTVLVEKDVLTMDVTP